MAIRLFHIAWFLLMPPLLLGVINRVKAWFAGRRGQPLLQTYWDVARLFRKGAVFSNTSSWVFQIGAVIQLAAVFCAAIILPSSTPVSPFGFVGDVVAFAYLLGLGRFFTVISALDTGSSFEGLGASREVAIATFAEPTLFLALAALCIPAHSISFGHIWGTAVGDANLWHRAPSIAAAISLFIVMLAESCRIPVDDPTTHLELTMVHEVMVLDHSGPDFAFITLGSALKLFLMGSLILHAVMPNGFASTGAQSLAFFVGQLAVAACVGVVESVIARYRLNRVPQFLIAAAVVAVLAIAIQFYRGVA